ncbi:hypothetical protein [Nocardioides sp.]|uniref:hypothetical protein n=1 Tax=Nocardioides sp. TaxID=35761 RepID=UPI0035288EA2
MGRAGRLTVSALVALGVVAAVGIAIHQGVGPLPDAEGCRAEVDGRVVELDTEQAENAALIAGIAVGRGLPPRAASIALATAYQESKLLNLEHGDRDSVGLFQQRPSQGWGTVDQILNPPYAVNAFYDALVKVEGYQDMPITEAAQAVQRSAFPDAYADHEADARVLASALTGETTGGAFSCVVHADTPEGNPDLNRRGLTHRANAVRREVLAVFGDQPMGGFAPGGVDAGHMSGSAHYDGRAVDVFVRPVDDENRQLGWAIAGYLVAQADRLHIEHVIFDGRIWTAGRRSEQGWRDYQVPSGATGDRTVLEHRDHVHVDVAP